MTGTASILKVKKEGEKKNNQIYSFLDKWRTIVIFFKQSFHHFSNIVLQNSKGYGSSNPRKKVLKIFLPKLVFTKNNLRRDNPLSTSAKFSEKLTFLTLGLEMLVSRKVLRTYLMDGS